MSCTHVRVCGDNKKLLAKTKKAFVFCCDMQCKTKSGFFFAHACAECVVSVVVTDSMSKKV